MLTVIFAPIILGIIAFLLPRKWERGRELLALGGTLVVFYVAIRLFGLGEAIANYSWFRFGNFAVGFDLRLYAFSRFIVAAASAFAVLIALYSWKPLRGHPRANEFYAYLLITLGATNGAILSNNFVVMLVFWETLLLVTYLFITLGKEGAYRTATKSLILGGVADFVMILGIGLLWMLTGTLTMTDPQLPIATTGLAGAAFVLMMVGAAAKAGSMPFHTWIPDAAIDAPLPFMAFLPGALEKLLGVYLLGRIGLDFFRLDRTMSIVMMTLGTVTIILPVLAALAQTNYKKLLSFCGISQVGYMVLGIGTNLALGIAGAIWHMLNCSMYMSTLFLTAGSVEAQTGTTDLKALGGLRRQMPITALCALVGAAAISGIPPLNAYFSKEFIYHGAKETGMLVFMIIALVGSIFTLMALLKLTLATYTGEQRPELSAAEEAPWTMTLPMLVIAGGCVLFGVYNPLPLKLFIQPLLTANAAAGEGIVLTQHAWQVTPVTIIALACIGIAVLAFFLGKTRTRQAATAVDYVPNAPVLATLYGWSEKRYLDIYEQGVRFLTWLARIVFYSLDRSVNWVIEGVAWLGVAIGQQLRRAHTGLLAMYLSWLVFGLVILALLVGGVFR
jgi:NADH-quinone oxidoreductase subunit L